MQIDFEMERIKTDFPFLIRLWQEHHGMFSKHDICDGFGRFHPD